MVASAPIDELVAVTQARVLANFVGRIQQRRVDGRRHRARDVRSCPRRCEADRSISGRSACRGATKVVGSPVTLVAERILITR
jgi:hypothetical protein